MKKVLSVLVLLLLLAALIPPASAQEPPTITVSNLPADGILELGVGESVTFEIHVTSQVEFIHVQTALDQYYPGRSVFAGGIVSARRGTEAMLALTVTGKVATQKLPDSIAPVSVVVGVRYVGGNVALQVFDFGIIVK